MDLHEMCKYIYNIIICIYIYIYHIISYVYHIYIYIFICIKNGIIKIAYNFKAKAFGAWTWNKGISSDSLDRRPMDLICNPPATSTGLRPTVFWAIFFVKKSAFQFDTMTMEC